MSDFVAPEYLWLVVVGAFAAFAYGWGTGSNDVANAFGTSVGAKTLTLKQAVIIASIFEFAGGMVLGRVSTSTIANGIAQISVFYREPEVYAYGMVCALTIGFIWQAIASYMELNVSATHSIVGSIIGFSLVYGGRDAVNWATPDKASFPPYRGVVPIFVSWVTSPVLTAAASALIFFITRFLVLRRKNSYQLSFWVLPPMVMATTWICVYFTFTRGAKRMLDSSGSWSNEKSGWVAACVAGGLTFLTIVVIVPLLKWKTDKKFANDEAAAAAAEQAAADAAAKGVDLENPDVKASMSLESDDNSQEASKFQKAYSKIRNAVMHGMEVDIHKAVEEDPIVAAIHANAEVFDPKAEYTFSYLQVFSAICVIFSHGAGEVGYMAGPLTTVWEVVKTGTLPSSVNAPIWALIISALGLVAGLATYGYNVTRSMGARMAKLSPTRGFAAELATAMVIMICAQYGLPTSSSHCITGGIIGVGLLEGKAGVNWKFFLKTACSWIATLFVVGLGTAALFSMGVFAPSISCNKHVYLYENNTILTGQSIANNIQTTLNLYRNASLAERLTSLPPARWNALNASLASYQTQGNNLLTPRRTGTIIPGQAIDYLSRSLALLQNYSVLTLGQERVYATSTDGVCNGPSFDPTQPDFSVPCVAPQPLRRLPPPTNATKWD